MKEAKTEQHKTLSIMDGYRLFWGILLGALSVVIVAGFVSILLYSILFILGSVG